jgi:hypothetical protein
VFRHTSTSGNNYNKEFIMKTKNLLIYISLLMAFTSCEWIFGGHKEPEFVGYNMSLRFTDTSGNDLSKDINLADSIYRLDIIIPEPCNGWDNDIYNTPGSDVVSRPDFSLSRPDSPYLTSYFYLPADECPPMKKLTYKIWFPALFGDDLIHEVVSYWDVPSNKKKAYGYATCFRIEFEGKEIIPTYERERTHSLATIVLD